MLSLIPDNYYPCELLPLECSVLAGTSCSTRGSVMPQDTLHAPDVPDAASMRPRFDHIMRHLTTWAGPSQNYWQSHVVHCEIEAKMRQYPSCLEAIRAPPMSTMPLNHSPCNSNPVSRHLLQYFFPWMPMFSSSCPSVCCDSCNLIDPAGRHPSFPSLRQVVPASSEQR